MRVHAGLRRHLTEIIVAFRTRIELRLDSRIEVSNSVTHDSQIGRQLHFLVVVALVLSTSEALCEDWHPSVHNLHPQIVESAVLDRP